MPTYEYECDGCEHKFEEFQSMKDDPLTKCPSCGKKKLRRLFGSGAYILFKGSGFYQTDYRSESYKSSAKADQEAGKPAGGADGKSGADAKSGADGAAKAGGAGKPATKSPKSKGRAADD